MKYTFLSKVQWLLSPPTCQRRNRCCRWEFHGGFTGRKECNFFFRQKRMQSVTSCKKTLRSTIDMESKTRNCLSITTKLVLRSFTIQNDEILWKYHHGRSILSGASLEMAREHFPFDDKKFQGTYNQSHPSHKHLPKDDTHIFVFLLTSPMDDGMRFPQPKGGDPKRRLTLWYSSRRDYGKWPIRVDLPVQHGDFPWLCKRLPEGKASETSKADFPQLCWITAMLDCGRVLAVATLSLFLEKMIPLFNPKIWIG